MTEKAEAVCQGAPSCIIHRRLLTICAKGLEQALAAAREDSARDVRNLLTAARQFIEDRGRHEGEHIYDETVHHCERCELAYIRAEAAFDSVVLAASRALPLSPSQPEPAARRVRPVRETLAEHGLLDRVPANRDEIDRVAPPAPPSSGPADHEFVACPSEDCEVGLDDRCHARRDVPAYGCCNLPRSAHPFQVRAALEEK